MRVPTATLIAIVALGATATTVSADPPSSIHHPRCVANDNAKMHAPEDVALGPLDAVALRLGCPVG